MTSSTALHLAEHIIRNDMTVAGPLLTLLYVFRSSRGDPLGEAMMTDVLKSLYSKTDHCEISIAAFVAESEKNLESIAA